MGFGFEDGEFFIRYKQFEIKDTDARKCLDRFYKLLFRSENLELDTVHKFFELHQLLSKFSSYFCKKTE